AFLAAHYAARPGLEREPYTAQLRTLLYRSFGTSDAYSRGLRALGHDATDLIVNCLPLQQRWAREHGRRSALDHLAARAPGLVRPRAIAPQLRRIAMAQIDALDPEVVYFQDLTALPCADLDALRAAGRLVVGQIASPAPPDDQV